MNHYALSDISIGHKETFEVTITAEKMDLFKNLSGDLNPMHVDRDYAISHGYQDRLVYGMLVSSFYSTLVGMYLPGEKCLLNKFEVNYKKPVYVGDVLSVLGEVVDIRMATQRLVIKGKMINQDGVVFNVSEIVVSFTREG